MSKLLENRRKEIESSDLIVYLIDECHLLWGDINGYIWGKTSQRVEVPIKNERNKQTYYGSLNYKTKQFSLLPADSGNGKNTRKFLKYLQAKNQGKKILIISDGSSYHKSLEVQKFLDFINQNKPPQQWQITCKLFAPNDPQQNPVEDIWLYGKKLIREFYFLCKSFIIVKKLFELELSERIFDFPKLHKYGFFS